MQNFACLWSALASCLRLNTFVQMTHSEDEGLGYTLLTAFASCLQLKAYSLAFSDDEGVASGVPRVCRVCIQPVAAGRCQVLHGNPDQLCQTEGSFAVVSLYSL